MDALSSADACGAEKFGVDNPVEKLLSRLWISSSSGGSGGAE